MVNISAFLERMLQVASTAPLVMGSRGSGRLVAIALPVVITRLIVGDLRLQAGLQRSRATGEQRCRQVAADSAITELATGIGVVLRGQVLGIGQQLVNFAIPIHPAGDYRRAGAGGSLEGALVEGADGLDSSALAIRTQLVLARQLLGVRKAWTAARILGELARALTVLLCARRGSHGGCRMLLH